MVVNPPAMQETRVQSLGWEDPLEGDLAAHPSTLAWRIPRTEEPGGLQSVGSPRVGHAQNHGAHSLRGTFRTPSSRAMDT